MVARPARTGLATKAGKCVAASTDACCPTPCSTSCEHVKRGHRVDILFLERAGFSPERDLELAVKKDAGIDPGILAWLLKDFAVEPLPEMLEPLRASELRAYRDELSKRMRSLAIPQ